MSNPDCPYCHTELTPASVRGGGRVGWFCEPCEALYPDGVWVDMRDKQVGRPHP